MSLLSGISEFFGLDIGTSAIRIAQLQGSGPTKALVKYAYVPIEAKTASSDAKVDQQKILQSLKSLIEQAGITTKNVAVGIPSGRVFTTVIDIERLPLNELAKTIQYQADSLIPTPLNESKLDWAVLGDSPKDRSKLEILLSSVSNEFIEGRLDMLESIGLNVIAFEPDNLALARAIIPSGTTSAVMVLDIGTRSTDIVVSMNDGPRLTRSIPTGSSALVRAGSQNLNIDEHQAQQFIFKFGLNKDKLEGQIYQAILNTVDTLVSEIDKSIKFFQARYNGVKLDRIIVTGAASTLPEFPLYLANKFNLNVEIGNAWRNVSFPQTQQNELLAVASSFGVAVGLAERSE